MRKHKKAKCPAQERVPMWLAAMVIAVGSLDFVSDRLTSGRRPKTLSVAEGFSHERIDLTVNFGILWLYVTRLLNRVTMLRDYPQGVRTYNSPEFTSRALIA